MSLSDWQVGVAVSRLTTSQWGSILVGGTLGLGLTLFHFVAEHCLEPHVVGVDDDLDSEAFARMVRRLKIIPRVGLGVLLLIVVLMMFAARGL